MKYLGKMNVIEISKTALASILMVSLVYFVSFYSAPSVQAAVAVSYLQASTDTADLTTYTFASVNLGTAAADRYIIVAIHSRQNAARTIASVSIGGVEAPVVLQAQRLVTNNNVVGLAAALVPTGTSGNIVVTFSGAMVRASIATYRATGINGPFPTDSFTSLVNDPSGTIDVIAGGFAIGVAGSGGATTMTWTGITETYDAQLEANMTYSGAMSTFASTQTNLAVAATVAADLESLAIVAAWAPFGSRSGGTQFTTPVYIKEDADVTGTIAKGSGTFAIDHPMDPTNKILYHSFVESPDAKNLYDGIVILDDKGIAKIKLPDYFEALNKDYRFLLTPIGQPAPELFIQSSGVENNQFTIAGGPSNIKVSWQVTGIRHDPYILANPIIPEVMKGPDALVDIGEYLFEGYETDN